MKTELKKIYEGSIPSVILLQSALQEVDIEPIIKDRAASAQMAGFGSFDQNQEVFVFEDQYEKANEIMEKLHLNEK
ncbi:MAG: DUF2007 domain-containing protein [Capnocytophaga sp.]|nr:DUF2007 domain-containing protein [Capnocytophaga sp.]